MMMLQILLAMEMLSVLLEEMRSDMTGEVLLIVDLEHVIAIYLADTGDMILLYVGVEQEYYPGGTWSGNVNYWMNATNISGGGYQWIQFPTYHPDIDPQSYGLCYGAIRRPCAGGDWNDSARSGSRFIMAANFPTRINVDLTGRGCNKSEHYPGANKNMGQYIYPYSASDSVYNSSVDPQTYGGIYGWLRRAIVGGGHSFNITTVGSRCMNCDNYPNRNKDVPLSARGCSDSL